jgi:hypothetical protein
MKSTSDLTELLDVIFRENKSRLIEGEDYFELGSDEIRRHLPDGTFSKFAASGIVLVESGYLMLVKSFTDDLAWQVQRTG